MERRVFCQPFLYVKYTLAVQAPRVIMVLCCSVKAALVKLSYLGCYDVLKVSKVPIKEIIGVYGMPGKK